MGQQFRLAPAGWFSYWLACFIHLLGAAGQVGISASGSWLAVTWADRGDLLVSSLTL